MPDSVIQSPFYLSSWQLPSSWVVHFRICSATSENKLWQFSFFIWGKCCVQASQINFWLISTVLLWGYGKTEVWDSMFYIFASFIHILFGGRISIIIIKIINVTNIIFFFPNLTLCFESKQWKWTQLYVCSGLFHKNERNTYTVKPIFRVCVSKAGKEAYLWL